MCKKRIIELTSHEPNEILSNIFTQAKKDGLGFEINSVDMTVSQLFVRRNP
jgi:hypothetical protein